MRVLVADTLSDAGVSALADSHDVDVRTGMPRAELLAAVAGYDAIVVRSATTIDAEVIAAADALKVIARAGIGIDNIDVEAATARGIIVCNAPQSNTISAAEHTIALLLALARRIPLADRSLRDGAWERSRFQGVELHGRTLGVMGLGRVGTLVAQRCAAFGMRLAAYDPYVSTERADQLGIKLVASPTRLCEIADIVTIHLPRTPDTVGMVGPTQLRALGPDGMLINTARGGIVDEDALGTALRDGVVQGAALDVFAEEPTTASPLFALPNVVVTPHLGASTKQAQDKAGVMVAEAVTLALRGEFVPSAVNLQVATAVTDQVRAFMGLTTKLGRLFTALYEGVTSVITVEYRGRIAEEDTSALNLATLTGLLTDVVDEPVTFVNAPLTAAERGLKLTTMTSPAARDFVSVVRLTAEGENAVAGTLIGPANRERLVELWGFEIDMEPSDHMLFFRYVDRPGIIGKIGSLLGDADINIATMQVGRHEMGGDALIAMTTDSAVSPSIARRIAEVIGSTQARTISLPSA
ncbi:MAG: phosphoglycerate dehydrogenase [Actinobacteria bacterium]|nr:phosphoglycerate dehydrogenase [Actinomycetota bacterium]